MLGDTFYSIQIHVLIKSAFIEISPHSFIKRGHVEDLQKTKLSLQMYLLVSILI